MNFEFAQGVVCRVHRDAIVHIAFAPNNELFATCSLDKSLKVWDLSLAQVVHSARTDCYSRAECVPRFLSFSPNSMYIIGVIDQSAISWHMSCGMLVPLWSRRHHHLVKNVAIFDQGVPHILSQSSEGELRLWTKYCQQRYRLPSEQLKPSHCAFANSQKHLVVLYRVRHLFITAICKYDVLSGELISSVFTEPFTLKHIHISENGTHLAVISEAAPTSINVRDIDSGIIRCTIEDGIEPIVSCALSLDGKLLASINMTGSVRIYIVDSGCILQTITHPMKTIRTCAFSFDSKWLVLGCADGTMFIHPRNQGWLRYRPLFLVRLKGCGSIYSRLPDDLFEAVAAFF
eukprot:GILJ01011534.1.p1 GENE.GILJ01011534.1~~GILJ01011534.1.p1  ORF type:complete len:346 (+),score=15.97 GILJ01011534.1:17-1054(+)